MVLRQVKTAFQAGLEAVFEAAFLRLVTMGGAQAAARNASLLNELADEMGAVRGLAIEPVATKKRLSLPTIAFRHRPATNSVSA